MALHPGLPPRRISRDCSKLARSLPSSTLDLLIDMGFSKQLSEKVIAAVGDKDIHVAVDWLMSHLEDPTLKDTTPREYMIYLCPVGTFSKSLLDFWEKSEKSCGWNGVHTHFPHITLTPFFKVPDDKMPQVLEIFSSLKNQLHQSITNFQLERYSVTNFIGLFVPQKSHDVWEKIMLGFSTKLKELGIELETRKKQLHLTLAYHFPPDSYECLNSLSNNIDITHDVRWDLRLYSRDHRHSQSQVYMVQQDFTASSHDEIDLIEGDYMFVDTAETRDIGDGWLYGTSWLTGCSGVFPSSFCKRTSEMWTWTLHRYISLDADQTNNHPPHDVCENDITTLYSKVKRRRSTAPALPPRKARGPRHVYVMRHGERIDFVLGKEWIHDSFNENGEYIRSDLNMPRQLPRRPEGADYYGDSPLTELGLFQAQKMAESMYDVGVRITQVYASPSFRCIQTATQIIRGLGSDLQINVEPALFEWLGWYQSGIPKWLPHDTLAAHGYPINRTYSPVISREKLMHSYSESVAQFYQRNHGFIVKALAKHSEPGEGILVVGHAATLDACMRQSRGLQPRSPAKFQEIVPKVPYCTIAAYQENTHTQKWSLIKSPCLPLTHAANKGMYWTAYGHL